MARQAYEIIHAAICEDSLSECLENRDGKCLRAKDALYNAKLNVIDSKKLGKLEKDSEFLGALEAAGVDNWEGYSYAFEDEEEEDD